MGLSELELYNRRQEELRREAENWRLSRALRQERPKRTSRTGSRRWLAGLDRATALWGRTSVPFFRTERIADAESEERNGQDER